VKTAVEQKEKLLCKNIKLMEEKPNSRKIKKQEL
jgi:hypothetical protein